MRAKICPVCKNKFYKEDKCFEDDSFWHYHCTVNKKTENRDKQKPVRTSTPIAELESTPSLSFVDSVTDFFYQSWKSGLHLDEPAASSQRPPVNWNYQPYTVLQPICYAPQIYCVNTVIFQPYLPAYTQQVGYRPDGTFGVLPPIFWQ